MKGDGWSGLLAPQVCALIDKRMAGRNNSRQPLCDCAEFSFLPDMQEFELHSRRCLFHFGVQREREKPFGSGANFNR